MKKLFSLFVLLSISCLFFANNTVKAADSCEATLVVHYHRFHNDYDNYELYTWGNTGNDRSSTIESKDQDQFGSEFEIPICRISQNEIGIILKEKNSWNKDGIDVNQDGEIDNRYVNVADIKGTDNIMNVYLLEGAGSVYYQNPLKDTYFAKPGFGNLVVIYYNPEGNDGWDDFWTWGTGTNAKEDDITFDYTLGVDGGVNPNLFKVGVINIARDADDQVGLIVRKDRSWNISNTDWKAELDTDEMDRNGNTYQKNGSIMINVTDIKGSGFKFIYVINGVREVFSNFDQFKAKAFELSIQDAYFKNKKELLVTLNKSIVYNPMDIDVSNFNVIDQNDNEIPIDYISYDTSDSSTNTFNIVLKNDIEEGNSYTVTYNYNEFGSDKKAQSPATISDELFILQPLPEPIKSKRNYTPFIISGIVVVLAAGAGILFMHGRRK